MNKNDKYESLILSGGGSKGICSLGALQYLYDNNIFDKNDICLLYTSPSPRDLSTSRMPSSA